MNEQTQANCPFCLSTQGYVRQVTVKEDLRIFRFTCEDCKRTWEGETHRIVRLTEERPAERVEAD